MLRGCLDLRLAFSNVVEGMFSFRYRSAALSSGSVVERVSTFVLFESVVPTFFELSKLAGVDLPLTACTVLFPAGSLELDDGTFVCPVVVCAGDCVDGFGC